MTASIASGSPDTEMPSTSRITLDEFATLTAEAAPFAALFSLHAEDLGAGTARFRMVWSDLLAAPAEDGAAPTVAGAALMALADFAIYGAILSVIGNVPLAVTTNLNTTLVKLCPAGDVLCEARVIRAGRRLVIAEAWMRSAVDGDIAAHAVGTYSVPPDIQTRQSETSDTMV